MEEGLKKIKLEGDTISESEKTDTKKTEEGETVLLPKIELNDGEEVPKKRKMKKLKFKLPKGKVIKIVGGVVAAFIVIFAIAGALSYRVYKQARRTEKSVKELIAASEEKDFGKLKQELENTKEEVKKLQSTYKTITWMKIVPFIGGFVKDGQHGLNAALHGIEGAEIVIETIEPYAGMIGFTTKEPQVENGETTQNMLDFVIKTIPDIIPKSDELIEKVALVKAEVDKIDPDRYPEEFSGMRIREKVKEGIELVDLIAELVENSKPLLEAAPYLLGSEDERTYMIIFQNDKELRPTGGFLTGYSIAKVSKGKFEPVTSNDIYNLDNLYTPSVEAPEPLRKYIKGPYLITSNYRLRDMNWSPDFSEAMELFTKESAKAGIDGIDGIIAVDTQALVNVMYVLVEIQVPGYGGYSNNIVELCKCPQIVYELEHFADLEGPIVWSENEPGKIVFVPPNYDNRKIIIGPMMNTILSNALGLPAEKMPALFEAIARSILEKHVLVYMFDEEVQKAAEDFGIAGVIKDYGGDYLHVNDANLGGRKSNLYVTQEVQQDIEIARDGTVEKTLTITYKNPEKYTGWLNSVLPNWVRIYVPEGSELIETQGLEDEPEPYEELGKTVFAGYFELRPLGVSKVEVKYKLPFKVSDDYSLYLQKQPGKDAPLYVVNVGKTSDEFFLRTDKEIRYGI